MGKAAQRRAQRQREAEAAALERRMRRTTWVLSVLFVDGTVQVHGFSDEDKARAAAELHLPELDGVEAGVQGMALKDCTSDCVVQRWGAIDAF
jgi:hypothetical protein